MRWENLFDDLEVQLESEAAAASDDRARDVERVRLAQRSLAQALHDELESRSHAEAIEISTNQANLWITVDNFGSDWIAGEVSAPASLCGYTIVNLARITQISLPVQARRRVGESSPAESSPRLQRRLGRITFRIVLRDLARRRRSGTVSIESNSVHGTLDMVGSDFIELACHASEAPRRADFVNKRLLIALSTIDTFRLDA